MTYDGHGRMKTRHYPIEDAQTETTWNYNADDSINQIIDPRGAITNFTHLVNNDWFFSSWGDPAPNELSENRTGLRARRRIDRPT